MDESQAMSLIGGALPAEGRAWADIGAGDGTFTRVLTERFGRACRVYAIDRDRRALARLERRAKQDGANVITVAADLRQPFELPGLDESMLDGILLANALHFVPEAEVVLARLVEWLRPGGRVVLVEYDRRGASRWVPHPIPIERLPRLAHAAHLLPPILTETRPSAYGGNLYVATADRPAVHPAHAR